VEQTKKVAWAWTLTGFTFSEKKHDLYHIRYSFLPLCRFIRSSYFVVPLPTKTASRPLAAELPKSASKPDVDAAFSCGLVFVLNRQRRHTHT
jgi:hypothetical protein